MSEKKNSDYEKPESKGMGDELEDISAGAGATVEMCENGSQHQYFCNAGDHPGHVGVPCWDGNNAASECTKGNNPWS